MANGSKNRVKIQHYYTLNAKNAPGDLVHGEIAVSHTPGHEGIYIISGDTTSPYKTCKIIDSIQTENLIKQHFIEANVTNNQPGYVKLYSEDVPEDAINKDIYKNYATTPSHTHDKRYVKNEVYTDFINDTKDTLKRAKTFFSEGETNVPTTADTLSEIIKILENGEGGAMNASRLKSLLSTRIGLVTGITDNIISVTTTLGVVDNGEVFPRSATIMHLTPTGGTKYHVNDPLNAEIQRGQIILPDGSTNTGNLVGPDSSINTGKPVDEDNIINITNGDSFNIMNVIAVDNTGHIVESGISAATVYIKEFTGATSGTTGAVKLCTSGHSVDGETLPSDPVEFLAANYIHKHPNYLSKKELSGSVTLEQDIIISCGSWDESTWE